MIKEGLTYSAYCVVESANTAATLGSGDLDVFATPAMVALMESAAMMSVAELLPDGSTTVGTSINIAHSKASAVGEEITATATLTKVDGRALYFDVVAQDSVGEIGRGTHQRFIVDCEKFISKLK